jgi:hypothetical protein
VTTRDSPAPTVADTCAAALLPDTRSTASASPCRTYLLIPSLAVADTLVDPYSAALLVSFSQKSSSGAWPSDDVTENHLSPRSGCQVCALPSSIAVIVGRCPSGSQVQVLRYHRCGSTWMGAESGPRLIQILG